ncbi:MAG: protease inhibitor I42 family protein, partial [Anaerolineae bacterium]
MFEGGCWKIVAVALLFAVTMAGCGDQDLVRLDAEADESQVEMEQGEVLVVTLEGNPSTGYTWERADDGGQILEQEGEPVFTPESDKLG